jgi:hypothetical protein
MVQREAFMATITSPPSPQRVTESQRRVHHPLERLRNYIRFYVTAEGLTVLVLYLTLWFWIGLALDYGAFKLLSVDWVQELPWGLRAGILVVLVAGLLAVVAVKVLWRLLTDFRDRALALVLERRFPEQLGDRLITAVELADTRKAARYGYSRQMIEQTIVEAADRVEQVPVGEAFAWGRLITRGVLVGLLLVGLYLLTGLGACAYDYAMTGQTSAAGFGRLHEVGRIWVQRNVLLRDVLWPRRAFLELVGFPASGELRVGQDAAPPTLRARALQWIIAAPSAPEKWRALTWADLEAHPEYTGGTATQPLPADWLQERPDWTVDQVQLRLARGDLDVQPADVLDHLDQTAAAGRYRDELRKVVIPDTVYAISRGATSYNTITMQKTGDNEFAGTLADLKESVRFNVRGEDFYTPTKRITLVPPPGLVRLERDEYRPAYLYYRQPADSTPEDFRARKQVFRGVVSSVSGSDTTRISVPYGTDIVLRGQADKPLRRRNDAEKVTDGVRLMPPRKNAAEVKAPVTLTDDTNFEMKFEDVTKPLDFLVELTDTDNVVSQRHILLNPVEDRPPEVEAQVEVIRKTAQGYMVTPFALVPFSGRVRDDHGLTEVNYVCTLAPLDGQAEVGARALAVVSALSGLGGGLGSDLATAARVASLAKEAGAAKPDAEPERQPMPDFVAALEQRAASETVPQAELLRLLALSGDKEISTPNGRTVPHPISLRGLFNDFPLTGNPGACFDMTRLQRGPKVATEREIQPRYRMQLWVEGVDNDVLTGPHRSAGKEKFTFVVTSVNDLLSEIAKEEEGLHVKLDDMVTRLKEGRSRLDQVIGDLGAANVKPEQFPPMSVRSEEIEQVREKSETAVGEVLTDYQRILKEMDYNRVQRTQPNIINRVQQTIVNPLDEATRGEFPRAKEGLDEFRKVLDAKDQALPAKVEAARKGAAEARARLDQLIAKLDQVLGSMEGLASVNSLIKRLRDMEEAERAQLEVLTQLKGQKDKEIMKDLGLFGDDKDKKPEKKK